MHENNVPIIHSFLDIWGKIQTQLCFLGVTYVYVNG